MDTKVKTSEESLAEFWKGRYQRQKLLIASITSLLSRYGGSNDIDSLQRAFVLMLMGHYVLGDACYFSTTDDGESFEPTVAYGRIPVDKMPKISVQNELVAHLLMAPVPAFVKSLPAVVLREQVGAFMYEHFRVIAPLQLNHKLIGIVALGDKVSGSSFRDLDIEILTSLCAVSATTFNNAMLHQNARYAAEEIEKLYSIRSEVIGRISHEFRTPLTVIQAGVSALLRGEELDIWEEPLNNSVDRLSQLIDSLLVLNLSGNDSSIEQRCDPVEAMNTAVHNKTRQAYLRGITINVTARMNAEECQTAISAEDMGTAIEALLDNAIKFSPDGDVVTVDCLMQSQGPMKDDGLVFPDWESRTESVLDSYLERSRKKPGPAPSQTPAKKNQGSRYFILRVRDNGIGIPDEEIQYIYEPFRQASNSPDHGVKGRGLGLSLIQKIASQAGGVLCCRSVENEGTTFSMFIPVA